MTATAPPGPGPLAGIRVVELGGIGPGPFGGMILADLGADVIRIDRPAEHDTSTTHPVLHRSRRSITVDLKRPEGVDVVLRLVESADALIEGFRPGTAERLGLGPDVCLGRNARLVYGRMTGWGQDGPLAGAAGHDINYIAVAGALGAIGSRDGEPAVPLNLVGDMGGGGLLLAMGICAALLSARTTGRGQVVDAAMTDGTALQLSLVLGLSQVGLWQDRRQSNLLDGAAPFYRTYRTSDGGHLAVGCIEPEFYAQMLAVLGVADEPVFARQLDASAWPAMASRLGELFGGRTREEWTTAFSGTDACVTPVLSLAEAATHPHNLARGTFRGSAPGPAPRFTGTPTAEPRPAPVIGEHTAEVLAEIGLDPEALRTAGVVG